MKCAGMFLSGCTKGGLSSSGQVYILYAFCFSIIGKIAFRLKSLEPFVRHFMGQKFLDMLEVQKKENVTSIVGTS
jgi:hypothetical protein